MSLPVLGDALPRRGNAFSKAFGRLGLRLFGWTVEGELPNVPKLIGIGAPHTSNWDFVTGVLLILGWGLDAHWIGKHTIFRWPFGAFFRFLGGIPVERGKTKGFVDQIVDIYDESEQMVIGIAPEGTRSKVDRWKTGFYHIAHKAGVPIIPIHWDYSRKAIVFGPPITTTGDLDADLETIFAYYTAQLGVHPLEVKG